MCIRDRLTSPGALHFSMTLHILHHAFCGMTPQPKNIIMLKYLFSTQFNALETWTLREVEKTTIRNMMTEKITEGTTGRESAELRRSD